MLPKYAKDSEASDQLHSIICEIHKIPFEIRTLNSCSCTRREIFVRQFNVRRPEINLK